MGSPKRAGRRPSLLVRMERQSLPSSYHPDTVSDSLTRVATSSGHRGIRQRYVQGEPRPSLAAPACCADVLRRDLSRRGRRARTDRMIRASAGGGAGAGCQGIRPCVVGGGVRPGVAVALGPTCGIRRSTRSARSSAATARPTSGTPATVASSASGYTAPSTQPRAMPSRSRSAHQHPRTACPRRRPRRCSRGRAGPGTGG